MSRLIAAALVILSPCALASRPEDLTAASKRVLDEARNLSRDGDYAAAAAAVNAVVTTFRPKLPASESDKLGGLVKAAAAYEARAEEAGSAAKDAKAARALLSSLLDPSERYGVEAASPADKRVAALLAELRQIDPKAKKFFAARPVRVVVTGDALSPTEAAALVEGVVGPLRSLGFVASAKEGTERLTLAVTRGEVIKDVGKDSFLAGALATSESCELKVDASWTVGETLLIRIDLSKRGIGFSDIPGQCVKARIKEIPDLVAPRLVKRWDSDYAP